MQSIICLAKSSLLLLSFLILCSCGEDKRGINSGGMWSSEVDYDPAWSPDGTQIIYTRAQHAYDTTWVGGLYLYDVAKGESTLLWANSRAHSVTWSPDGEWIAFSYNAHIWVMKLNGDSLTQLTTSGRNFRCKWSPAGNRIAYDVSAVGLWFCDPDGENQQQMDLGAWNVSWFQDGFHLAGLGLGGEVYIVDTLGETYSKITETGLYKYRVAVSPDGWQVVFSQQLPGKPEELWIVDIDGSNLKRLTWEGGNNPTWSPDGEWIVYTNEKYKNGHLWLMRPDGSEKQQITFR